MILIDRCGKHFGSILSYLRDGSVTLPKSRQGVMELLTEAKYYQIQGLVDLCQLALQVMKRCSELYVFTNVTSHCIHVHVSVCQLMHCVPYAKPERTEYR